MSTQSERAALWTRNILSPDTESASALILDFAASRTVRNECLLLTPQPGISRVLASLWHQQPNGLWQRGKLYSSPHTVSTVDPIIPLSRLVCEGQWMWTCIPRFSDWILALYISLQALLIRDTPANNPQYKAKHRACNERHGSRPATSSSLWPVTCPQPLSHAPSLHLDVPQLSWHCAWRHSVDAKPVVHGLSWQSSSKTSAFSVGAPGLPWSELGASTRCN